MSLAPITLRFAGQHAHGFALGELVEPYPFNVGGVSGIIPAGYMTDLESVPRVAQWMLPRAGRALRAALIHDYLITTRGYARAHDDVFLAALDLEGFRDLRVYPIRWALRINTWARRRTAPNMGY